MSVNLAVLLGLPGGVFLALLPVGIFSGGDGMGSMMGGGVFGTLFALLFWMLIALVVGAVVWIIGQSQRR